MIFHTHPPLFNILIYNKIHHTNKPLKIAFCDITNLVIPNKDSKFATEIQTICQTTKLIKTMRKKILFTIGAMLLFCSLAFAQNGGIPVEIKPLNPPPYRPPFGNITPPDDSIDFSRPTSIEIEKTTFYCFQNSTHLTLQCNEDERVEVVIYEMLSGVKHTSTINMVAGEIYTIATPWGTGLYTIRLTLSNGEILEGDFQIR